MYIYRQCSYEQKWVYTKIQSEYNENNSINLYIQINGMTPNSKKSNFVLNKKAHTNIKNMFIKTYNIDTNVWTKYLKEVIYINSQNDIKY